MKSILKYAALVGAAGVMAVSAMGAAQARIHHRVPADAYGAYGYAPLGTPGYMGPREQNGGAGLTNGTRGGTFDNGVTGRDADEGN
jgi:hypothetical protein